MKITVFLLVLMKIVCGSLFSEDLKFCVFAGDFEISTLAGDIKKRSEKMLYSVAVDFEQLNNFLQSVRSKTIVVTSRKILPTDGIILKRSNLLWVTMSDVNSPLSNKSYSTHENNICGPSITIGVMVEEGICDEILNKGVYDKTDCYHYQFMNMLGQRFNFTRRTVELEDKDHPYVFPNGSHSGLFNMVSDQYADVSCGSFYVTEKRLREYQFLWPTFFLESKMYLKREEKHNPWRNFLKPFEKEVWAAITLYLVLSGLTRYILYRFLNNSSKEIKTSLYRSFLLSLQIFCNQGLAGIPNHFSIRTVHFFSLLAIIVLYPFYSGSIVSFLTVKIPLLPFHDFEGFIADHRYTLVTSKESFMSHYFYHDSEKDFIGKRKNLLLGLQNRPENVRDGLQSICDGETLAYADSELVVASLINEVECDIVVIPEPILVQYLGMIVDENLPCRDRLTSGLLYFRSIGIIERMQSKMVPSFTFSRHHEIKRILRPISIMDVYPCLAVHALGLLLALLIFLWEIFFWKRYSEFKGKRFSYKFVGSLLALRKKRDFQRRRKRSEIFSRVNKEILSLKGK